MRKQEHRRSHHFKTKGKIEINVVLTSLKLSLFSAPISESLCKHARLLMFFFIKAELMPFELTTDKVAKRSLLSTLGKKTLYFMNDRLHCFECVHLVGIISSRAHTFRNLLLALHRTKLNIIMVIKHDGTDTINCLIS